VPKRCTLSNVINKCCTLSDFIFLYGFLVLLRQEIARGSPPGTTTEVQIVGFPFAENWFVSSGKGVSPIDRWHRGLEEKGACDIICGAKDALGLAVLRRGVGARHVERDAIGEEESASGGVVKLSAIVTLHGFDGATKLGANIGKEVRKGGESLRL
jgi:hypothetical protein